MAGTTLYGIGRTEVASDADSREDHLLSVATPATGVNNAAGEALDEPRALHDMALPEELGPRAVQLGLKALLAAAAAIVVTLVTALNLQSGQGRAEQSSPPNVVATSVPPPSTIVIERQTAPEDHRAPQFDHSGGASPFLGPKRPNQDGLDGATLARLTNDAPRSGHRSRASSRSDVRTFANVPAPSSKLSHRPASTIMRTNDSDPDATLPPSVE